MSIPEDSEPGRHLQAGYSWLRRGQSPSANGTGSPASLPLISLSEHNDDGDTAGENLRHCTEERNVVGVRCIGILRWDEHIRPRIRPRIPACPDFAIRIAHTDRLLVRALGESPRRTDVVAQPLALPPQHTPRRIHGPIHPHTRLILRDLQ